MGSMTFIQKCVNFSNTTKGKIAIAVISILLGAFILGPMLAHYAATGVK